MAFSLSQWFKAKPETDATEAGTETKPAAAQATVAPPVVRPSVAAVRTVSPQAVQPGDSRAPSARQAISLPVASPAAPGQVSPNMPSARKVSFGPQLNLPVARGPEAARAANPSPEMGTPTGPDVPVILEVGDFVDRLPSSFLQGTTLDRQRKVEFRSTELYSDLTKGRASVPASVIYQKCADIFSRPVGDTEDLEVALPLQKLVAQMGAALQTRPDQVAAENVGEIETPFLQVALEDNARLPKVAGMAAGPIPARATPPAVPSAVAPDEAPLREHHRTGQISTITPPKTATQTLAAPTAQSINANLASKRPPSTVRASVAGSKIRVSGPLVNNRAAKADAPETPVEAAQAPSPSHQVSKKTQRIQIPPISLRPPGAPPKIAAPAAPTQPVPAANRPVPSTAAPPTFRSSPGIDTRAANTFRSTPPPPPAIKPPPPSFSPRRTPTIPSTGTPEATVRMPGMPLGKVTPAISMTPSAPAPRITATIPPAAAPPVAKETVSIPLEAPASPAVPALPAAPVPSAPASDQTIALSLPAVLRGLPSGSLTPAAAAVPAGTQVTFPFRLIEPQLTSGRVAVPVTAFLEALPAEHRGVLAGGHDLTEVPLPLPEIFLNLPSNALSRRADQVLEETGAVYLTPFSQKADEDARRFGSAGTPVAPGTLPQPVEETTPPASKAEPPSPLPAKQPIAEAKAPVEIPAAEPVPPAAEIPPVAAAVPAEPKPAKAAPVPPEPTKVSVQDTTLQKLFMTEDDLDAKTIVKLVSQLPGVDGCAVMFQDGLRLAGNFPADGQVEGFSAMSPTFYKRTVNFAAELKLGDLRAFTIYTDGCLLSFFMHEDICLSIRHAGRGFLPGVREKLETVTRELAQMYSAPPNAPVAD